MTTPESIAAAIEAGKSLTQLHQVPDHKPVITAPGVGSLRLEPEKLAAPRFLTAAPLFHDPDAFVAYVKSFMDSDTRLFYTQDGAVEAVIDYHEADGNARHGDHTATLKLVRSPEWIAWANSSDKHMGQQSFAEFIEDNLRDLLHPDPETMLRVATGLNATVGAEFRQATNQANGQINLAFNETINGTVNGTTTEVPTAFQIGIRPFMGCERYPVDCRLRYRIDRSNGAALKLFYKALHLSVITETAVEGVVQRIATATGITPALGAHDAKAFARGQ